jgi:hypothetical protein
MFSTHIVNDLILDIRARFAVGDLQTRLNESITIVD